MKGLQTIRFKGSEEYSLFDLVNALKPHIIQYSWSVSDAEVWPSPKIPPSLAGLTKSINKPNTVVWLEGNQLLELSKYLSVVNWGAFLAFEPSASGFNYEDCPYSEGRPPCIQHPAAQIEIQAVDGGYFEVYARDSEVYEVLRTWFEVVECDSKPQGP